MQKISIGPRALFLFIFIAVMGSVLFVKSVKAAQWTYMIYVGGDNNLSESAISDIEEMRVATFGSEVNVIVQAELSSNYTFNFPSYLPDTGTYRLIVSNGEVQSVPLGGNLNMAAANTLSDFIRWGAANHPAAKYGLTIWDHGDGWRERLNRTTQIRGAVQDETSGSFMSLQSLGLAVANSGVHLDLLEFDACFMAMYEVAYEFVGMTDYMVFSEDVEPGGGNSYTTIFNRLASNPYMDGRELASLIAYEYVSSYQQTRSSVTKSVIDTSQVMNLHQMLVDLAVTMRASLSMVQPAIYAARDRAQHYEDKSNIDIVSFLANLQGIGGDIESKAQALSAFITSELVIANHYYTSTHNEGGYVMAADVDDSHGLAIFFPSENTLEQGQMVEYANISSNSDEANSWYAFLFDFLNNIGGAGAEGGTNHIEGGFAYGAAWFADNGDWGNADIDLYVVEPDGTVGTPWMGQSTNNGFFSADSYNSGESYEIYTSKKTVIQGYYMIIANYYDNGCSYDDFAYDYPNPYEYDPSYDVSDYDMSGLSDYGCNYANVGIYFMDYDQGYREWTLIDGESSRRMSLDSPAPEYWDDNVIYGIISGSYSDWWLPVDTYRRLRSMSFEEARHILLKVKSRMDSRRGKRQMNKLLQFYQYLEERRETLAAG